MQRKLLIVPTPAEVTEKPNNTKCVQFAAQTAYCAYTNKNNRISKQHNVAQCFSSKSVKKIFLRVFKRHTQIARCKIEFSTTCSAALFLEKKMKPFEELAFYDDFMFGQIMHDRETCKTVLEILLGIKIDRLEYPELQKSVEPFYATKGVRYDVYVEDGKRVYDVEIQNSTEPAIGKRTRFYQSMLDVAALMRGQSYEELKESIIIFICRYDPFQKGIPCYTVERKCREDGSVQLKDEATLYIFNCKAYENVENRELSGLLKFIECGEAETEFTRRLQKMVEIKKENEGLKTTYLSWSLAEHDAIRKGRAEGMAEGLAAGISKGIREGRANEKLANARNLLAMKVLTNEQIAQAVGLPLETVEELADQL